MNRTIIIAEAGVNHNGSIEIAKQMIDIAKEAGADIIKFQTFKAENLVCKKAEKAEYQKNNTSTDESQFEMLKGLELDVEKHKILMKYCQNKNITFLSTPFDLESVDLLNELGIEVFKIPSGEITNYPYLKKIARLKKKIILSTGMSYLEEVEAAIKVLNENGADDIVILHCNTEYPTPMEDANLRAMNTMKEKLHVEVGYSDHTLGIEVPVAAVAMGAKVIEKHFTLDKNMEGPDHKASLDPKELKEMIIAIRNIEKAMGDGIKKPSKSESKNIEITRKSIVANTVIKKGEKFTENNLTCKRPGNGVSAMHWEDVIGKTAIRDYKKDELIEL